MGLDSYLPLKKSGQSVIDRNLPYRFLSGQPLKALKTGFVENNGQAGPFSADSKTQGKCQLSIKFSAICQLSVNPIQTL